jgi:hypothetical protein
MSRRMSAVDQAVTYLLDRMFDGLILRAAAAALAFVVLKELGVL